jgi:beta-lactamase regulating signal transducer with metallopeptidase domain
VFWFHPLAWWLSRKISNLSELACDAAVLGEWTIRSDIRESSLSLRIP